MALAFQAKIFRKKKAKLHKLLGSWDDNQNIPSWITWATQCRGIFKVVSKVFVSRQVTNAVLTGGKPTTNPSSKLADRQKVSKTSLLVIINV